MFIEAKQIVKWKETRRPHPTLICALCGRKMEAQEKCLSALWRAQGGMYIQAYHGECAKIVKLWGYPVELLSPKGAEEWARRLSCNSCVEQHRCAKYVFDCEKALSAIKFIGGTHREDTTGEGTEARDMNHGREGDADRAD